MDNQLATQAILVDQTSLRNKQLAQRLALFSDAGAPVTAGDLTTLDMTGFSVGANSTVLSSDTVLGAVGKLQGQINALKTADTPMAHQANSVAATVGALVTDFNALLAKLQASGFMA